MAVQPSSSPWRCSSPLEGTGPSVTACLSTPKLLLVPGGPSWLLGKAMCSTVSSVEARITNTLRCNSHQQTFPAWAKDGHSKLKLGLCTGLYYYSHVVASSVKSLLETTEVSKQ